MYCFFLFPFVGIFFLFCHLLCGAGTTWRSLGLLRRPLDQHTLHISYFKSDILVNVICKLWFFCFVLYMPRILHVCTAPHPPIKLIRFRFYMTEDTIYNIPFVYQKEITSLSNRKTVHGKTPWNKCILIIVNTFCKVPSLLLFLFFVVSHSRVVR